MFNKRIVTIHAVDEQTLSPQRLVHYIKVMQTLGYVFISLKEVVSAECRGRFIALTIDDAYKTCITNVMPILKQLHVPALLFIPTGLLGKVPNDEELLRCECYENEATMNVQDINLWIAEGFDIGFHTNKHIDLFHANDVNTIETDFYTGMNIMERNDWKTDCFAYPKGFLPRDRAHFENLLKKNGFQYAFTINWGKTELDNPFYINRICLGNKESFGWSILKTLGLGDWYFKNKRMHKEQMV